VKWVAAAALVVAVGGSAYLVGLWWTLPDAAAIGRIGDMAQATTVYGRDDQVAFTLYTEQRLTTPLDQVSPNLVHAIVAVEDRRFYEHGGFDLRRIAGAALADVRHMGFVQGASTITQQLAKLSFLTPDRTLRRKLQEVMLAERIERTFTKPQILELYLNKVFFGDGLYGAEAASRGYFDKHASELTVSEAALLAGLVKSPTRYAPTENMKLAVGRRDVVLQAMLETRVIDHAQWAKARAAKVILHDGLGSREPHGQYAKEEVRQELIARFGSDSVYGDGLRVYTTLDWPMQVAADDAVAQGIASVEARRAAWQQRRRRGKKADPAPADPPLEAALLALDPATGEIRAMVGGGDFGESSFNRAVQARRQPGSAFKPFVYASALEAGYTPATLIDHLDDPVQTLQGDWTPDDGHVTATALTMREALRVSSNRAAVHMLQQVGIPQTVQFARAMGVGDLPSVPSLALGSGEVTLQDMTAAYAAFADHGMLSHPYLIRRVETPDGKVLFETKPAAARVVSEDTAFLMSDMLADVVNRGTGAGVRRLGFKLPAGGKTGTTNDVNDAWFVGFTPHLAAGVWMGFDEPQTILPNSFAADLAVPLWTAFMKAATKGDSADWFHAPSDITTADVCELSGKLATDGCRSVDVVDEHGSHSRISTVYTEYFVQGTQPTAYCDLHPSRGWFGAFARLLQRPGTPAPPAAEAAAPAEPDTVAAAPAETPPPPPAPEKKKKRGFWSRLFGIGGDQSDRADRR
jgi:1A family penicillin-binding protein